MLELDLVTCVECGACAVAVAGSAGLWVSWWRDTNRAKKFDRRDVECPRLSDLPVRDEKVVGGTWPPPQPKVGRILPVKDLFSANAELIRKICQASQLPEDEYDAYLLPAIANLARIVHQLPASQYDHHSGFGGLFTHSLEVALFAVQEANATIFERCRPEENHQNRRRWYLLCILAGLAHDIGKPYTDMDVTTTGGDDWPKNNLPLLDWLTSVNAESYTVRYRKNREHNDHLEEAIAHMGMLIPEETFAFLSAAGHMQQMRAEFIRGILRGEKGGIVGRIIAHADARSRKRDILAQRDIQARYKEVENPQGSTILRAIQQLLSDKRWSVNESEKSPVFVRKDDCFVVWTDENAREIWGETKVLGFESVPKDPAAMAEVLVESGAAYPNTSPSSGQTSPLWNVTPILMEKGYVTCIRFRSPRYLFKDVVPEAIECVVEEIDIDEKTKAAWQKVWKHDPERLLNQEEEAERERLNHYDDEYVQMETSAIQDREQEQENIATMEMEDVQTGSSPAMKTDSVDENQPPEIAFGPNGSCSGEAEQGKSMQEMQGDVMPPSAPSESAAEAPAAGVPAAATVAAVAAPAPVEEGRSECPQGKKKEKLVGEDVSIPEDQRGGAARPHRKTHEEYEQERIRKAEALKEANTYDREGKSFADNFTATSKPKPTQQRPQQGSNPNSAAARRPDNKAGVDADEFMPPSQQTQPRHAAPATPPSPRGELVRSELLDMPLVAGVSSETSSASLEDAEELFGPAGQKPEPEPEQCPRNAVLETDAQREGNCTETETVSQRSEAPVREGPLDAQNPKPSLEEGEGAADAVSNERHCSGEEEEEEEGDQRQLDASRSPENSPEKFAPVQTFCTPEEVSTDELLPEEELPATEEMPSETPIPVEVKQENSKAASRKRCRQKASLGKSRRVSTELESKIYMQMKAGKGDLIPSGVTTDASTGLTCSDASQIICILRAERIVPSFFAGSLNYRRPAPRLRLDLTGNTGTIFLLGD